MKKQGKALSGFYIPNRVEPRFKRLCLFGQRRFLYALKASKGDVGKGRNIGGNHFVKDV
jgi:hypothetical protein